MNRPTSVAARELEDEIARLKARLAEVRRGTPRVVVKDYQLLESDGSPVRLSGLFGDKSDLLVVHNMGRSCPYCTLWADGFNGVVDHLTSRAAVAVVTPDEPETMARFAAGRGWRFRMASGRGSEFTRDMGMEPEPGKYWPGASGFRRRDDGVIERVTCATFEPGDDFCSVWHLFELLADGANGWQPRYSY